MSDSRQINVKSTFKMSCFNYKRDEFTRVMIVCHEHFPIRYENLEIVVEGVEYDNKAPEFISIDIFAKSDDKYIEEYSNSLEETDNKTSKKENLISSMKMGFSIFEINTGFVFSTKNYIVRAVDLRNKDRLVVSNRIPGLKLKDNFKIDIYCQYVEITTPKSIINIQPMTTGGMIWYIIKFIILVILIRIVIAIAFAIFGIN